MEKYRTSIFTKPTQYTDEFKRMVCHVYLQGNKSKDEISREFGIKGKSSLLTWLRRSGYCEPVEILHHDTSVMAKPKKENSKGLEKENEDLRLQLEMYKRMIALAEKEYKIAIEKKPDTK